MRIVNMTYSIVCIANKGCAPSVYLITRAKLSVEQLDLLDNSNYGTCPAFLKDYVYDQCHDDIIFPFEYCEDSHPVITGIYTYMS